MNEKEITDKALEVLENVLKENLLLKRHLQCACAAAKVDSFDELCPKLERLVEAFNSNRNVTDQLIMDYDHPWPNEDEDTRDYRLHTLEKMKASLKSL